MPDATPVLPTTLAPFRIGPDWLALSMSGPVRLLEYVEPQQWIGGRVWIDAGINTRVMSKVFYLLDSNARKLLTVAGKPFSRAVGPPDWMLVQFANETLHTGEHIEIYQTLRSMGFLYKSIARLDLAADGLEDAGGNFNALIEQEQHGSAQYYGKLHWTPRKEGRTTTRGAMLGSPASNKWFRVYDKTRELKSAGGQHKAAYIRAAWEAALGFDPVDEGRTVQRFEFRTKGREVRRYFKEESTSDQGRAEQLIIDLFDQGYCASVFASMAAKCYDFRTPAARARDARKLVQWDFGALTPGPLRIEPREPRKMAITDTALKQTCKGLFRTSYITADRVWMDKAREYAAVNGLGGWLERMSPKWEKELQAIMRAAMDTGETSKLDNLYKLRRETDANDIE